MERAGSNVVVLTGLLAFFARPFVPWPDSWIAAGVCASWFACACFIGIRYSRRWGGSARDTAVVTIAIWAMIALPFVSCTLLEMSWVVPIITAMIYGTTLDALARTQGRYLNSQRDIPRLEGEPGTVAVDVLTRAGLKPAAILVASLPGFNAVVQGLRTCILIVDRRASRELPRGAFGAMIAHEAGHLRRGDTLLRLSILSVSVTVGALLAQAIGRTDLLVPAAGLLFFSGYPLIAQWTELRADRFALSLAGAADTAHMLRLVHADRPLAVDRAASSPLLAPFLTHPPLPVRLHNLGADHDRIPAIHGVVSVLRMVLALGPLILISALPTLPDVFLWHPLLLLAALTITAWGFLRRSVLRSFQLALGLSRTRFTPLLILLALFGLMYVAARFGGSYRSTLTLGVLLLVALFLLMKRRLAPRTGFESLPNVLRGKVVEALAAVTEGVPEQGLAALETVPQAHRKNAWFLAAEGVCLLHAGRPGDAKPRLEESIAAAPDFVVPRHTLAALSLIQGDLPRAQELAAELCRLAPEDPASWRLKGMVHQAAGETDAARESFSKTCVLKPSDPGGLAGLAMAAIDAGAPPEEVERHLGEAAAAGPQSVAVLMAQSRWLAGSSRKEEAVARYGEAMRQLDHGDLKIWKPYYESLARRWGFGD